MFRMNGSVMGAPLFGREQIKPADPRSADATHDITLNNNAVFCDLRDSPRVPVRCGRAFSMGFAEIRHL
ncbi:MAG: hypothetical protein A3G24_19070 [Betaproteobacteria bacterium RIFCSPLOWO2_12_FULL_62_13]|nr:MAG: hypothetical protein A3G24_19070 [Betaproteobacteria bacterium RIFCSPLOWO2_12_FULL_62_13]